MSHVSDGMEDGMSFFGDLLNDMARNQISESVKQLRNKYYSTSDMFQAIYRFDSACENSKRDAVIYILSETLDDANRSISFEELEKFNEVVKELRGASRGTGYSILDRRDKKVGKILKWLMENYADEDLITMFNVREDSIQGFIDTKSKIQLSLIDEHQALKFLLISKMGQKFLDENNKICEYNFYGGYNGNYTSSSALKEYKKNK